MLLENLKTDTLWETSKLYLAIAGAMGKLAMEAIPTTRTTLFTSLFTPRGAFAFALAFAFLGVSRSPFQRPIPLLDQ